ncbi:hypothetical protein A3770_16p77150 [Chloropicon primus]|uniref:WD40 repeat domain-containing protein n=2 Tax=Chloropicon primus TaxID=1764295 RepID=A0A5B8MXE5_9CHLO|nr:hypothetical protein A3770_16p77150 [Chloropicon primus]|eukprot:QDZ25197.1 hypothetical protein A3770_16p77150 [Chloropicon primus]
MPVDIPGFVFDPVTNRYYKAASRSEESSSANRVLERIAVHRGESKKGCGSGHKHWNRRRRSAKKRRTSEDKGAGVASDGSGDSVGSLGSSHGEICDTILRLIRHRECGRLPLTAASTGVQRLCYETRRGVKVAERRNVTNAWFGEAQATTGRRHEGQRVARTKVHFNFILGNGSGYVWSRGATNKVATDDALVCTCFVPTFVDRATVLSGRKKPAGPADRSLDESCRIRATHLNYPTKSPAIHVSEMGQAGRKKAFVFGLMGSGLETGKVVVHMPKHCNQLLPRTVLCSSGSETASRQGTTLIYRASGTLWTVQNLGVGFLSIGERESARVLQIGDGAIRSLWQARYGSDVLAQACVPGAGMVLHGLRSGWVLGADCRTRRSVVKCKAGRSIQELVVNPRDPHQFAVLGYEQFPRLWDTRMVRPLVKYHGASSPASKGTANLRISWDGDLLGCSTSRLQTPSLSLWSLKTGKEVSVVGGNGVHDFIWCPQLGPDALCVLEEDNFPKIKSINFVV